MWCCAVLSYAAHLLCPALSGVMDMYGYQLTILCVSDPDFCVVSCFVNHCISGLSEHHSERLCVFSNIIVVDLHNDTSLRHINGKDKCLGQVTKVSWWTAARVSQC